MRGIFCNLNNINNVKEDMKVITQTFKRFCRQTGKFITVIQTEEYRPKGTGKRKMTWTIKHTVKP